MLHYERGHEFICVYTSDADVSGGMSFKQGGREGGSFQFTETFTVISCQEGRAGPEVNSPKSDSLETNCLLQPFVSPPRRQLPVASELS